MLSFEFLSNFLFIHFVFHVRMMFLVSVIKRDQEFFHAFELLHNYLQFIGTC